MDNVGDMLPDAASERGSFRLAPEDRSDEQALDGQALPLAPLTDAAFLIPWPDLDTLTWTPPTLTHEHRTLLVGPARQCQWPAWSHRERPTHVYCAAPSLPDRSYCADHCARIFQRWPPSAKTEKAA